jgi:DUF1365 family protein
MSRCALYAGSVVHQRLRPARHRLRYRVFSLLVDLDELPALARRLRLFSLDRFNLFSLHQRDYGDLASRPAGDGLRGHVDRQLRAAGLPAGGRVLLLTMPRILGYAFNPLSVYFCHGLDGSLQAIVYEVNNTFGERHSYLIAVAPDSADAPRLVQRCAKAFHVSPFLPLDLDYVFRIGPPHPERDGLAVGVIVRDRAGVVMSARFDARRRRLDDLALARVFCSHPLLTLKVIAAIHWEALRLVLKGIRVHPAPTPPAAPLTIVETSDP